MTYDKPMETPFHLEQVYDASIQQVWQALTDEHKMRDWYFPQLIKFKPVVDFEFVFSNDGVRRQLFLSRLHSNRSRK